MSSARRSSGVAKFEPMEMLESLLSFHWVKVGEAIATTNRLDHGTDDVLIVCSSGEWFAIPDLHRKGIE